MTVERTRRYYDDFSRTYERGRDRGYHALIDELEASIVEPYARGRRVLEAGCGTGLILARLDAVAERAVGVDLSAGMLGAAHARGLHVVQGSVTALPFADASFDTVCSFKVLAHVPDIEGALAELARVTRPGGHLILELYNRWSLRYLARRLAGARRVGAAHTEDDVSTRWDTPRAALARLPSSLELVDVRGVRVVTPFAALHRVVTVAPLLARAERVASRSPLRWLGGFLVLVLRRR
ncbi:MAG TPA: class I SAM-dependent methyltransferase [Sandaracinaceae bacterium LLY-WYZ-13_1]|nr:class I SAM-dependent methyltransferase [Sandaracinaceae bacterium LLY-WYZ-13_1]